MLIVISNPGPVVNETSIINELFDNGMSLFHLRKPDYSQKELRELLHKIKPLYYSKIVLHQHHEVACDFGISRVHFTETKRKESKESVLRKKTRVNKWSTSVHSIENYKSLSKEFDYVFFGPVFNSISKQGYTSVIGDDFNLTSLKSEIKIIAIGGINAENVHKAYYMGFDGVAVLGAIWQEPIDSTKNFKKIINRCTQIGQ